MRCELSDAVLLAYREAKKVDTSFNSPA
jgi:hypothetical protein